MDLWKTIFLYSQVLFKFYVNFPGCRFRVLQVDAVDPPRSGCTSTTSPTAWRPGPHRQPSGTSVGDGQVAKWSPARVGGVMCGMEMTGSLRIMRICTGSRCVALLCLEGLAC